MIKGEITLHYFLSDIISSYKDTLRKIKKKNLKTIEKSKKSEKHKNEKNLSTAFALLKTAGDFPLPRNLWSTHPFHTQKEEDDFSTPTFFSLKNGKINLEFCENLIFFKKSSKV